LQQAAAWSSTILISIKFSSSWSCGSRSSQYLQCCPQQVLLQGKQVTQQQVTQQQQQQQLLMRRPSVDRCRPTVRHTDAHLELTVWMV
jgi:hypothetical protein